MDECGQHGHVIKKGKISHMADILVMAKMRPFPTIESAMADILDSEEVQVPSASNIKQGFPKTFGVQDKNAQPTC